MSIPSVSLSLYGIGKYYRGLVESVFAYLWSDLPHKNCPSLHPASQVFWSSFSLKWSGQAQTALVDPSSAGPIRHKWEHPPLSFAQGLLSPEKFILKINIDIYNSIPGSYNGKQLSKILRSLIFHSLFDMLSIIKLFTYTYI